MYRLFLSLANLSKVFSTFVGTPLRICKSHRPFNRSSNILDLKLEFALLALNTLALRLQRSREV